MMDEQRLAEIEARAAAAQVLQEPIDGGRVWGLMDARCAYQLTRDAPALLAEVRRLRQTADILWDTLSRDQKPYADQSLRDAGLDEPPTAKGYRGARYP